MNEKNIVVSSSSNNFLWGYYGFCEFPSWEDFRIYHSDNDKLTEIGKICVCTRNYIKYSLEVVDEAEDDDDDGEYVSELRSFLESDEIRYRFYYDDINDEDFYEIPYDAPRNEIGVKPRSIELWLPYDNMDIQNCENAIKDLCLKIYKTNPTTIKFDLFEDKESAYGDFIKYEELFGNGVQISFSEEVINDIKVKTDYSDEVVTRLLENSIK